MFQAFLRLLAEYTADDSEKQKLLQLSSRQGSSDFENSVRLPGLSLLDILLTYPSCLPPVEVMIEHLPRLIPRAYSIASSPLESKESFTIAFNVISFSKEEGRKYSRLGVCTGWLLNMCKDILEKDMIPSDQEDLSLQFENLSLNPSGFSEPKEVVLYRRKNHNFRLPENLAAPIIMVGPGTGVAPFIGKLNSILK
jgi:methionine synthase reductase